MKKKEEVFRLTFCALLGLDEGGWGAARFLQVFSQLEYNAGTCNIDLTSSSSAHTRFERSIFEAEILLLILEALVFDLSLGRRSSVVPKAVQTPKNFTLHNTYFLSSFALQPRQGV